MRKRSGSRRGLIGSFVPLGEMYRRISMHGTPRGRHRLECPASSEEKSLANLSVRQN